MGEGLGECRGEAYFMFFAKRLLVVVVTAPRCRWICYLTQGNFSYKPRLPCSSSQLIYDTQPIQISLSVASRTSQEVELSLSFTGKGATRGKKGSEDHATR